LLLVRRCAGVFAVPAAVGFVRGFVGVLVVALRRPEDGGCGVALVLPLGVAGVAAGFFARGLDVGLLGVCFPLRELGVLAATGFLGVAGVRLAPRAPLEGDLEDAEGVDLVFVP